MIAAQSEVRIVTVSASSQVKAEDRGQVIVSGSYGGEYNAWHAGKWGIRGVILNDAGIGRNDAGIRGLPYLDQIGLAAATADANTCHIADGEHMLAHGIISHVNRAAAALGCKAGDTVRACAEPRPGHPESWINEPIVELYSELHRRGHAHSVECRRDGQLVGGLYGVTVGAAFFGESMFSRERDASKVALVHLVARLIVGGFRLLDCQFMTEHLRSFGAVEISREEFRTLLADAIDRPALFQRELGGVDPCAIVQDRTRTS